LNRFPGIKGELKKDYNIDVNFDGRQEMLKQRRRGNTFKPHRKPVLSAGRRRCDHHDLSIIMGSPKA